MYPLVLLRHGESAGNQESSFTGRTDAAPTIATPQALATRGKAKA
jgi:bisphosphoglycerate-dependent phosphoglycerate mutase